MHKARSLILRNIIFLVLYPLSVLFRIGIGLRSLLFSIGVKKRSESVLPSIGVGNLTVGGTGKTPFSEYLIEELKAKYSIAFLSRGYGRQTNGYLAANKESNSESIGDEPFQVYTKYGNDVSVHVCEKRVVGVERIKEETNADLVVLDDVFQHRMIKPTLNILLNNYHRPFQKDYLLPAGRLRDARSNAKFSDIVVYTKCPNELSSQEQDRFTDEVKRFAGDKEVFFTKTIMGEVQLVHGTGTVQDYMTLTGIADSEQFESELASRFGKARHHYRAGDHHVFTDRSLQVVFDRALTEKSTILTTEKDWARIQHKKVVKAFEGSIFVLPLKIAFLNREAEFWELVAQGLQQ